MWAAPPIRQWSPYIPHAQFTTTNIPASMCLPVGVPIPFAALRPSASCFSAGVPRKFQLYSQLRNLNLDNNSSKPVENCLTDGVPRKFQLYSQLRNLDLDNNSTTDTGNLGKAVVVAAVKSGSVAEQKQQNTNKSRTKYRRQGAKEVVEEKGDSKEEEKKLSGLDVLRALEKATAQKMKKKRNVRDSSLLSTKLTGQGRNRRQEDEALVDYGNKIVRPLNIKEDWGTRLDELERRLQELVDTTAA